MTSNMWETTSDEPLIAFDVTTNLDDHLAFNRYLWTLPAWHQSQIRNLVAIGTLAPLVALIICFALVWAASGGACDLDTALGLDNRGLFFAKILAGLLAACAIAAGALWLWRRRNLTFSVRAALLRRPHIKADDPELRETSHISFHPRGYRFAGETAAYAYSWTYTKRFDETADHIFIMAEPAFGFVIPKRDLAPDTLLTIREVGRQVSAP